MYTYISKQIKLFSRKRKSNECLEGIDITMFYGTMTRFIDLFDPTGSLDCLLGHLRVTHTMEKQNNAFDSNQHTIWLMLSVKKEVNEGTGI